jgi:acyl-CoA synthetase (AMP-forming)/AMP-acid ligase II
VCLQTCSESGRSFTFGEARAACERLSVWLPAALGLRQGDALGLLLPNGPDFAIAFLAAASAGIVVTPANPLYTAGILIEISKLSSLF